MTIRQQYNRQMSLYFIIGLLLHLPVFAYQAYSNGHSFTQLSLICGFLLAGPISLYLMGVSSALLPSVLAFTTIGFSGLLIHLQGGMIEMHFHIFISLATFIAFGLRTPIVVGVVTTAVHHLAFFFFLPASVFNYKASLAIVLLHAFFVVLEAVPVYFIACKFKKLIDLQDSTVDGLETISSKITTTVGVMAVSGNEMSENTFANANSLEETALALEELKNMVQQNSNSALTASKLSVESKGNAENGEQEVKALISSMDQISTASKKIKDIISVIDDIAFQTNLLALNAAVEAARAGEQGRGFAVVADAVRSLAQKSAEAAKDISSLIQESVAMIETGALRADKSGEVLNKIVQSVKKVSELNDLIAQAGQEQSNGINRITASMKLLDASTSKNAECSQAVTSAVNEIQEYSHHMSKLVNELSGEFGSSQRAS